VSHKLKTCVCLSNAVSVFDISLYRNNLFQNQQASFERRRISVSGVTSTRDHVPRLVTATRARFCSVNEAALAYRAFLDNIRSLYTRRSVSIGSGRRSQWPRHQRHELSSPARKLGSWVLILLEALISVCIYSLFILSRVQVASS
jgi:hypothetical protein